MIMNNFKNYHHINMIDKVRHDGLYLLERSLNSFDGYDAFINNSKESTRVLVHQKWDANSETKKIIGRAEDIDIGNLIKIDNTNWLIVTFPEDNRIYHKAEMRLCNTTFPVKTIITEEPLLDENGQPILDRFGDPIYKTIEETISVPCIAEKPNYTVDSPNKLPILDGDLNIWIQYREDNLPEINYTFKMYNQTFKVNGLNFSKVINGKGIVGISAKVVID